MENIKKQVYKQFFTPWKSFLFHSNNNIYNKMIIKYVQCENKNTAHTLAWANDHYICIYISKKRQMVNGLILP